MQYKRNTRRGFTLIELLVVVLIIGILAAVAVPQYQRAVEKSRAVQAFTIVKALGEAQDRYLLSNGRYATTFDAFDIDVPGENSTYNSFPRKKTDYFDFGISSIGLVDGVVFAQRWEKGKVHVGGKAYYSIVRVPNDSNLYCKLSSGGLGDPWNICKTLSAGKLSSKYAGWYVIQL